MPVRTIRKIGFQTHAVAGTHLRLIPRVILSGGRQRIHAMSVAFLLYSGYEAHKTGRDHHFSALFSPWCALGRIRPQALLVPVVV